MLKDITVIIRSVGRTCLYDAIKSVLIQQVNNLEIVVVDAKGFINLNLPFAMKQVSLKLVSNYKQLSRSAAANLGLDYASGQYCIFLDEDDLFLENHLSALKSKLQKNPTAIAAYSGVKLLDNAANLIDVYNQPFDPLHLISNNVFPIHAVLFRAWRCKNCRFDEDFEIYEDWDFWLQVSRKGTFVHHDCVTAIYRIDYGQSGINNPLNDDLRTRGRIKVYDKWRHMFSGEVLNNYISSIKNDIFLLNQKLNNEADLNLRYKSMISDLENKLTKNKSQLLASYALNEETANKASILNDIITNKDKEIRELNNAISEKDRMIRAKKKYDLKFSQAVHDFIELQNSLDTLDASYKKLIMDYKDLEKERDFYKITYKEICDSFFWKITYPARKIITKLLFKNIPNNRFFSLRRRLLHFLPLSDSKKQMIRHFLITKLPSILHSITSSSKRGRKLIDASNQKDILVINNNFVTHSITDMLPETSKQPSSRTQNTTIDVIIPIYDGFQETQKCIESILKSHNKTDYRVILINDKSPSKDIIQYLHNLPEYDNIILLHNTINIGFTGTVNRGMMLSKNNDVILLNSDTEVPDGWIDRLVYHAYSADNIGSVTPFSNNGTICSYPNLPGSSNLPSTQSLASLDEVVKKVNSGRSVELPTAVGFCMYIRRDCLNEVGFFDAETFGRGYGEENDFCMRASKKGWRHIIAADLFIYHAGEVSFGGDSAPGKEKASTIIRSLYPYYDNLVADFVRRDPLSPYRISITAGILRCSKKPVVLFITHGLGGGIDKHVKELSQTIKSNGGWALILSSIPGKPDTLSFALDHAEYGFKVRISLESHALLIQLLKSFAVTLVHIHHLMHWYTDVQALVGLLGCPFYFTFHDYFLICPRVTLTGPYHELYCGEPGIIGCQKCLMTNPLTDSRDIIAWRIRYAWIVQDASLVIFPSHDARERISTYYPLSHFRSTVVYHEPNLGFSPKVLHTHIVSSQSITIVILGVLARHKGLNFVFQVADLVLNRKVPIKFILLGYCSEEVPSSLLSIIKQSGGYDEQDLPEMISNSHPDLVWFPTRCPETYSYTLTHAIKIGVPILAPNIGAFSERLAHYELAWLYDWESSANDILDWLLKYSNNEPNIPWRHNTQQSQSNLVDTKYSDWYLNSYFASLDEGIKGHPFDLRKKDNITIIIPEMLDLFPSPCAYIRIVLPFQDKIYDPAFRFATAKAALHYLANTYITHRVAFNESMAAIEFLNMLAKQGASLIYDIDDDLLNLQVNQDERSYYNNRKLVIESFIRSADLLQVSTSVLGCRYKPLNDNVKIFPNRLDWDLWSLGSAESCTAMPIRILYMGTMTHKMDWEMMEPILRRIIDRRGNTVEMHIIGIAESKFIPEWVTLHTPPIGVSAVYPAFVQWLKAFGGFHIGIAPLLDNPFNAAKSGIKFMDYTALGATTIASDLPPYSEIIRNGENGILIPNNSPLEWEKNINLIIDDKTHRDYLWDNALTDLISKHSFNSRL